MNAQKKLTSKKRRKTPAIQQMEAVECGAVSLAIILRTYGRAVPLEELRIACGISRDGVKASNIVKAAQAYGLDGRGYRAEPEHLNQLRAPVIIHWNFNHFLVLEGIRGNRVYLNDPASGRRTVTREELDQAFTGVVLTFEPGPDFRPGGEKYSTWRGVLSRFRDRKALLFVTLAGLLLVPPGLVVPMLSKVFIDQVLVQHLEGWFRPLILGLVLTALLNGALTWLQGYYLFRYQMRTAIEESARYVWSLMRLPVVFFSQRMAGDLVKRIGNNEVVADLLTGRLTRTLLNFISVLFYVALMLHFDPLLTAMGVFLALLNMAVLLYVADYRAASSLNYVMEMGKAYGTGASGLQLIETLKATASESDFFSRWAGYHARAIHTKQKLGRVDYLVSIVPTFLSALTRVAILTLGGLKVMDGELTIGGLVAFQSLMVNFMAPFNGLVAIGAEVQTAKGMMEQLDDVYRAKPDPAFAEPAEPGTAHPKLRGALEIHDLTFGYNPLGPPLIEGFNLKLEPGRSVALVGRSGSGKSTIARLIAGLYVPWGGDILLDGREKREHPRGSLVSSIAFVDQNITLFEGSVRENLTMWDSTLQDAPLLQAARDALIHDTITARVAGYGAHVAEGGKNFSGGQRQRLEIARGLAQEPSLLILDEATSALDADTERRIGENIRRRGCSCLIVAHRLSTIRDCDEIIVLDKGKVVQRGSHPDLASVPGPYLELLSKTD